jgi:hypothetical protein
MNIEPGMLVKSSGGSLIKTANLIEPGYWACDDGHTYLEVTFCEISDDERKTYAYSQNKDGGSPE